MARSNDSYRLGYGASNYSPSGGGGPSVSFGGIGNAVRDYSNPGRSFGSGVGATLTVPMKRDSKKKGGKVEGGKADMAQDKALIKKAFRQHDAQEHKGSKGTKLKLAKGGSASSASKRADGCCVKGKTKGRFV
jgi:hypothetical protein